MHADAMAELARALRDVLNLEAFAAVGPLSEELERKLMEAHAVLRVAEIVAVQSFTTHVWLEKKARQAGVSP